MNASEYSFQKYEAYFSEATLFDELVEDEGIASARPWGVSLSEWEDLEEHKPTSDQTGFYISQSSSAFKGSPMRREIASRREALLENQVGRWPSSLCLVMVCRPDPSLGSGPRLSSLQVRTIMALITYDLCKDIFGTA